MCAELVTTTTNIKTPLFISPVFVAFDRKKAWFGQDRNSESLYKQLTNKGRSLLSYYKKNEKDI